MDEIKLEDVDLTDVEAFERSVVWRYMIGVIKDKMDGYIEDITETDDILDVKKYVGARQELQIILLTPQLLREEIAAISEEGVEENEEV